MRITDAPCSLTRLEKDSDGALKARWRYRIWQFFMRLGAYLTPEDTRSARGVLHAAAWELFVAMPRGDRWHALCVYRRLCKRGGISRDLAQAALLHDVGKASARLTLVHRALIVLLGRMAPDALERLSAAGECGWRHPFHVHRHHDELGAALCEGAGCSARTVHLVRHHERAAHCPDEAASTMPSTQDEELDALREADDLC